MSRRGSASVFGGIGSPSGVRKSSRRPAALFSLGLNPRMPSRISAAFIRLTIRLCSPAGHTVEVIDPKTGEIRQAQIFVAVLGASSLTFAMASFTQRLPDWIENQTRALAYFGGVPKAIVCDNLKAGVAKALWFEPTLNQTFAAVAEHYDTTILPTRSRKPRDKGKVEGAVLIVERWILARLRHVRFFSLADLNAATGMLLEDLNNRPMRRLGKSRGAARLLGLKPSGDQSRCPRRKMRRRGGAPKSRAQFSFA